MLKFIHDDMLQDGKLGSIASPMYFSSYSGWVGKGCCTSSRPSESKRDRTSVSKASKLQGFTTNSGDNHGQRLYVLMVRPQCA